ncbi:hypothetical protein E9993_09975 [Labilibacter sediminis]|nr:hypothetical protein E9993_09975 [Labilibacter sediminis]
MAIDLSGSWKFKEDFSFGKDEGVAELNQEANDITGVLSFTEIIEGEEAFEVRCQLKGTISDHEITLNVVEYEIVSSSEPIEYYPETREGIVNVNGQIVGSSEDEQGVCGVFVLERM